MQYLVAGRAEAIAVVIDPAALARARLFASVDTPWRTGLFEGIQSRSTRASTQAGRPSPTQRCSTPSISAISPPPASRAPACR